MTEEQMIMLRAISKRKYYNLEDLYQELKRSEAFSNHTSPYAYMYPGDVEAVAELLKENEELKKKSDALDELNTACSNMHEANEQLKLTNEHLSLVLSAAMRWWWLNQNSSSESEG